MKVRRNVVLKAQKLWRKKKVKQKMLQDKITKISLRFLHLKLIKP
jgi:hypothetical protein